MQPVDYADWIGRSVTRHDVVTERLVEQFRATLAPHVFDGGCPPGLHWCLAVPAHSPENLGPDGAEKKGLFLPPIELPRRMWAGGCVETFGQFHVGDEVKRVSHIADIKWRYGGGGKLCIVSLEHELSVGGGLVVRERNDLLFRDGAIAKQSTAAQQMPSGKLHWSINATPLPLFRFSALTFNGHRIHYDLAYARDVEGYDGLLVHGPLQAALMLNKFSATLGHVPQRFDYRCVAPLTAEQTFRVTCDEDGHTGRILNAAGVTTLEASAK